MLPFFFRKSEYGRPAHAALEGDHMTCLALLIRRGADLQATNYNQQTLLQCIKKKYGQTKTERLLKETGKKHKVKEEIRHIFGSIRSLWVRELPIKLEFRSVAFLWRKESWRILNP